MSFPVILLISPYFISLRTDSDVIRSKSQGIYIFSLYFMEAKPTLMAYLPAPSSTMFQTLSAYSILGLAKNKLALFFALAGLIMQYTALRLVAIVFTTPFSYSSPLLTIALAINTLSANELNDFWSYYCGAICLISAYFSRFIQITSPLSNENISVLSKVIANGKHSTRVINLEQLMIRELKYYSLFFSFNKCQKFSFKEQTIYSSIN